MIAMKAAQFSPAKTAARVYSFALAYAYIFLSAAGLFCAGHLAFGIIRHEVGRTCGAAFMCVSFYMFCQRPGRLFLKDFPRRRNRALRRQLNVIATHA